MPFHKKSKQRDTTKATETRLNSAPAHVPAPSADVKRALVCSPKPAGTVSFKRAKGASVHHSPSNLLSSPSYSQVAQNVFRTSVQVSSPRATATATARKLSFFAEGVGIIQGGLKPPILSPPKAIRKAQFSKIANRSENA